MTPANPDLEAKLLALAIEVKALRVALRWVSDRADVGFIAALREAKEAK